MADHRAEPRHSSTSTADLVGASPTADLVGATSTADLVGASARAAVAARALDPLARGRALLGAASEVDAHRAEFVDLVRTAHGARISEAVAAVDACIDTVVRWAGWADKLDLLVPGVRHGRRPAPVGVLAPAGFLACAHTACAGLAAGGSQLLAHDSRAVESLVELLAAEFPPGTIAVVPRDAKTVHALAQALPVLDARAAAAEFDAELRRVCAQAGTRVLPPRPGAGTSVGDACAPDLEQVAPLYAELVTTV